MGWLPKIKFGFKKRKPPEDKFYHVATISPEKNRWGKVEKDLPHKRYGNKRKSSLHKYGRGPFCRFRIHRNLKRAGVYMFSVDRKVKYVGECQDLSKRVNNGYGDGKHGSENGRTLKFDSFEFERR